jgi:hypothetical protein
MPSNPAPKAPRTDLNGLRIKHPDHPAIYFIDSGFKRLIPNPQTHNNLFVDWNGIVTDIPLEEIPDGPFISDGAVLVRPSSSEDVFLVDRGSKRLVASPEIMERYRFNPKKIVVVPPILINSLPAQKPLSA